MRGLNDVVDILEAVIESAIDGIITIDSRGNILTFNKAAVELFGFQTDQVMGQNIKILMPEPYHSEHDKYLKNYLETRKPKIIGIGREVQGRRKNGEIFPLRLAVSEVILNDRIVFTGIVHDLSKLKEAQNQVIRLNEKLEEEVEKRTAELEIAINRLLDSNKKLEFQENELQMALAKERELNVLKSRFVSMASHEFRTPLSTILSSASLISKYEELDQQEKRLKHVDRIKSAVNNLTGILNDFLSLSKLEEGGIQVFYEEIDIHELCLEINEELKVILKTGQAIRHSHEGIERIQTDKKILKNILFNILSNAIKYSGEGQAIDCKTQVSPEQIIISVQDKGIGIPVNEQKYLFERFYRASNVENIQGTGLGLHIVLNYLQLLNGSISFESREFEGTTFKISILNRK